MSDVESGRQMAFEWSNLSVAVPVKRKAHDAKVASGGGGGNPTQSSKSTRQILKPTSGLVSSGDVLAIMGPSGSGKTTLLDALAGRMKLSCVSGSVTFDGKALTEEERRMHVSYVAQEDSLMGVFTVRETVRMAVRFYHGYGLSGDDLEALESKVLTTVGLTSAANTIVGDIFRKGLSGGQKRRLSLAVELVKEPKVLILDEPTSGLDSASAFGIMTSMTSLAKLGHTILCTIHQPSSDIWAVFDKFLLLSEGSTLYFGKAAEAVNYFGALGHPCPQHCNPADFFLGLVNTDFPLHSADLSKLEKAFSKSTHIATDSSTPSNGAMLTSAGPKRTKACGPFADFCTLSRRNILNNLRNPGIFWVRFVMYAMLSLMIGLMYRGLGDDKSGSVPPALAIDSSRTL
jgi:ABC-type multidrug transport system ATPase subunit